MPLLSQLPNQSFIINDHIRVVYLGRRGNQIQIGIDAPRNVDVHRNEIYQKIQRERQPKAEVETET